MKPNRHHFCGKGDCCPVADVDQSNRKVKLHDPVEPENGAYTLSFEQYAMIDDKFDPATGTWPKSK